MNKKSKEKIMFTEWLGINGFRFCFNDKIILLDPWLTRNSIKVSDKKTVAKYIHRADYIFIGHSHYDHLADAAEIYRQTGAVIIGSETTVNICRAQAVPETHLIQFHAGEELKFNNFKVNIYASIHKEPIQYPGEYTCMPAKIEAIKDYLEGGTFALGFQFGDLKILNIGSANFLKEELEGVSCDYLLAGIAGATDSYITDLVKTVSPSKVIPTHFDYFETPLEDNQIRTDVRKIEQEVLNTFPGVKVIIPLPLQKISL